LAPTIGGTGISGLATLSSGGIAPEPSSVVLLGVGALGLFGLARRSRLPKAEG
jgi:hypothetical protein